MSPNQDSAQTISPAEARRHLEGALMLDVRTPAEFGEMHIREAVLQPLSDLRPEVIRDMAQGKTSCVVICRSGNRARQAAAKLRESGIASSVLEGGMQAWEAAGFPVERGRKTISLERQVRIAAGALVLTGSVLAHFAHPGWIVVPAFVGAGLMFAGITDTCGMGLLLARMPWNTRSACDACCSPRTDKTGE